MKKRYRVDTIQLTFVFGLLCAMYLFEPGVELQESLKNSMPILGVLITLYLLGVLGTYIEISEDGELKYVNFLVWRKTVPLGSIRKIVNKPGYKIFRKSVRVFLVTYENGDQLDAFEINPAIFKSKVIDEFLEDIKHRAPHIEFSEITP